VIDKKVISIVMLQCNELRVAEILVLVFAVVYATDQDGTSACSLAKLALKSEGINLLEIAANPVSGNISAALCFPHCGALRFTDGETSWFGVCVGDCFFSK